MSIPSIWISGKIHKLGKRLGRGGEGDVYVLEGDPGKAVKIYKDGLRQARESKVTAMVQGGIASTTQLVAFPSAVATDTMGHFAGFVMRLVAGYRPVHELYSPKSRKLHFPKADYRFLVRAAQNVARAVATVHQAGCIIGDFNHSGVLVGADATVALIDADSFQFTSQGRSYPCLVGVPEFTPPELQGKNLASIARTKEHDNFSLAVVVFHLLAMGKHPYAGRFSGRDLSLGEAIAENRFAFSILRRNQTQTTPPPGSVALDDFPAAIANAFEAAFGTAPGSRPGPADWALMLLNLEQSLNRCGRVSTHYYPAAAGECLWCRQTNLSGVEMFPPALDPGSPIPTAGAFDIERMAAAIRAITLPTPADLLPKWAGSLRPPSAAVRGAKGAGFLRKASGVAVMVAAVMGLTSAPKVSVLWLGLGVFGLFLLFGRQANVAPIRQAYVDAEKKARAAEEAFLRRVSLGEFYALHADMERGLADLRKLDVELNQALARLRSTRQERKLNEFLDQFLIRRASISGIGPAKTATLASFGVETAADITSSAVYAVPGFGQVMTGKLLAWRRQQENKFRYNPAPDASDAQAEAAVRAGFITKRISLQNTLHTGMATLQSAGARLTSGAPDQMLMSALGELAAAERDCAAVGISIPSRSQITITRPLAPTQGHIPSSMRASPVTPQRSPLSSSSTPSCPSCGSTMLRRTARRGSRAGSQFWGCSRYPTCKGTRS